MVKSTLMPCISMYQFIYHQCIAYMFNYKSPRCFYADMLSLALTDKSLWRLFSKCPAEADSVRCHLLVHTLGIKGCDVNVTEQK